MTTLTHLLAIGLVASIPIGCLLTVEYLARRTAFPLAIPVATARSRPKQIDSTRMYLAWGKGARKS